MGAAEPEPIRIAAAVIVDADGRLLLVRKRGTAVFIQPGGKIEPDETPLEALTRELKEELGVDVAIGAQDYIGRAEAPAANEVGRHVVAELFRVPPPPTVQPAAEVEEVLWVSPAASDGLEIAPLTQDHVMTLG